MAASAVNQQTSAKPIPPKQEHPVPAGHAGERVTVACKFPQGIVMQLHKWEEVDRAVFGGSYKTVKEARPDGEPITARGWRGNDGKLSRHAIGMCGLTPNVPLEFWQRWLEENKKAPFVVQGLIFDYKSRDHVVGEAKEKKAVMSGLEPLNMARTLKTVDGVTRSISADERVRRETPRIRTATNKDGGDDD